MRSSAAPRDSFGVVGFGTTATEQAIHLALFVCGGLALGMLALAAVERLAGPGRRIVRGVWVGGAVGLFFLLFAVERLYHSL